METSFAFQLFLKDGRALLDKRNLNIREYELRKMDPIIHYTIELSGLAHNAIDSITNTKILFYGVEKSYDGKNNELWQVGNFLQFDKAEAVRKEIVEEFPSAVGKVVQYMNGERIDH